MKYYIIKIKNRYFLKFDRTGRLKTVSDLHKCKFFKVDFKNEENKKIIKKLFKKNHLFKIAFIEVKL